MKVLWTKFALNSLETIYKYYKDNVSLIIAENVVNNIVACTGQLEAFPQSGTIEGFLNELKEEHKFLIRGNYKIIYKIQNHTVYITDVFDTRQNPENIRIRYK